MPHGKATPTRVLICNRAAGDHVRVNIRALANTAAVRKEKRNGRDVVIVPSATLPDNVVMNDILYPADEIAKGFKTLERTPAPLGHPTINGNFVSARDPEGINLGWIGAWNENVRQEKGRVLLDKVIDVEIANQSAGGKAVLAAIEAGGPVHTSTGLMGILEAANGDVDHKHIMREMVFDHDAILLAENGAATPEQGVGMMVNAAGQNIEVINCGIPADGLDQEIDWAGTRLIEAVRRKADASKWQEMRDSILKVLGLSKPEATPSNNQKDDEMDKVQFDELSARVNALSEAVKPDALAAALATVVGNAVAAAMKPITDAQEAATNAQKAKDDEELVGLVDTIVKANLLDEPTAKELTLNAARALAKTAKPGKAAALNGAFKPAGETAPAYSLPEGE